MTQAESGRVDVTLTRDAIVADVFISGLGSDEDGAVNVFLGVTRNHHQGRAVLGLEYHCYEEMAMSELKRLAEAIAEEHSIGKLVVVHRLGRVAIGETSLLVAAASHHREQALLGTLDLINRLKRDVPIWKREYFADGSIGWVEGSNIVASKGVKDSEQA